MHKNDPTGKISISWKQSYNTRTNHKDQTMKKKTDSSTSIERAKERESRH